MRRRCRRFAVEVCRPGYSVEVVDSCSGREFRTRLIVLGIDYMMEVALVSDREDSAGRNWNLVVLAVKEDIVDYADCTPVWDCESWRMSLMRLEGCSYPVTACEAHVSAARMTVRLIRTGCPDHIVKTQRGLESCRCSNIQAVPGIAECAERSEILVVQRTGTTLGGLGRSSRHCCSNLHAAHWKSHAGLAPGMMLVELAQSTHRCLSFARQTSTHNCCSDSMKPIS